MNNYQEKILHFTKGKLVKKEWWQNTARGWAIVPNHVGDEWPRDAYKMKELHHRDPDCGFRIIPTRCQ